MSALIIHRRNALLYYSSDHDGGVSVPLPAEAVSDMEILNEELYVQTITALAAKIHAPVNAMLILSDDMCYFAQTTPEKIDAVRDELVRNTPFSHVETTVIRNDKQMFVVATNADVYESAVHAFADKEISISMVIPWSALLISKVVLSGEVDKVTVKRALDASQILKNCIFPLTQHEHRADVPSVKTTPSASKKISVGWVIFISLAVLYAIGMIWFFMRP